MTMQGNVHMFKLLLISHLSWNPSFHTIAQVSLRITIASISVSTLLIVYSKIQFRTSFLLKKTSRKKNQFFWKIGDKIKNRKSPYQVECLRKNDTRFSVMHGIGRHLWLNKNWAISMQLNPQKRDAAFCRSSIGSVIPEAANKRRWYT